MLRCVEQCRDTLLENRRTIKQLSRQGDFKARSKRRGGGTLFAEYARFQKMNRSCFVFAAWRDRTSKEGLRKECMYSRKSLGCDGVAANEGFVNMLEEEARGKFCMPGRMHGPIAATIARDCGYACRSSRILLTSSTTSYYGHEHADCRTITVNSPVRRKG